MTAQSSALATTTQGIASLQHLVKVAPRPQRPASPPPGARHPFAPVPAAPTPVVLPRRPRGRPRTRPLPAQAVAPISSSLANVNREVASLTDNFVNDIGDIIRNATPAEFFAWVGLDPLRMLPPAQRRRLLTSGTK